MIKCLAANYKFMNRRTFVVNTTFGIKFLYGLLKPFISPMTKSKVVLTDSPSTDEMHEMIHPSMLEDKFDGEAP